MHGYNSGINAGRFSQPSEHVHVQGEYTYCEYLQYVTVPNIITLVFFSVFHVCIQELYEDGQYTHCTAASLVHLFSTLSG